MVLWLSDDLSFFYLALGLVSHGIYYQMLKSFPDINLYSAPFIASVGECIMTSHQQCSSWAMCCTLQQSTALLTCLVLSVLAVILLANHYFWFKFFTARYFSVFQVMGFFQINVWMVPFSIFICTSLTEGQLPTDARSAAIYERPATSKSKYSLRGLLSWFRLNKQQGAILPSHSEQRP